MSPQTCLSTSLKAIVAVSIFGFALSAGAPAADAKSCYRVVDAKFLNLRAKARISASVITSIKGGTVVRKSGLPTCGIWWCKVNTGKHVGYAGSKFLRKTACP